ncbi:hypothetical protein Tco_0903037, partial [Tanacetum coccineum]
MFDKEMKRVNTFVDIDTELVKGSETRVQENSSKRAGTELELEVALSRVNTLGSKLTERASAKAKIVNRERQIQALVDKKKLIITETSIRSDLKLDDAEGIDCLPTASIFTKLERMGHEH